MAIRVSSSLSDSFMHWLPAGEQVNGGECHMADGLWQNQNFPILALGRCDETYADGRWLMVDASVMCQSDNIWFGKR